MIKKNDVFFQSGQALTEYVILISMVVGFFVALNQWLSKKNISGQLNTLLTTSFSAAYQYGHTKAKGFDNGGPQYHPRVVGGDNNFRIFLQTNAN